MGSPVRMSLGCLIFWNALTLFSGSKTESVGDDDEDDLDEANGEDTEESAAADERANANSIRPRLAIVVPVKVLYFRWWSFVLFNGFQGHIGRTHP